MKVSTTNIAVETNNGKISWGTGIGDFVIEPHEYKSNTSEFPEWGNIQISLSYPIPEGCFQPGGAISQDKTAIWETPESRDKGRYRGVYRVGTHGHANLSRNQTAITFGRDPSGEFGDEISYAVGTGQDEDSLLAATYTWLAPTPKCPQKSAIKGPEFNRLIFKFNGAQDYYGNELCGTMELVSFEILQYRSALEESNQDSLEKSERFDRFLLVHFIAVDCNNPTVDLISTALSRPRNKINRKNSEPISILNKLSKFINENLNAGMPGRGKYKFSFEAGGYLKNPGGFEESNLFAQPVRTVCAIPNIPASNIDSLPNVFKDDQESSIITPSIAKIWASQLSTGYDFYAYGIPSVESIINSSGEDLLENNIKNWVISVDNNGLALIRTSPELKQDLGPVAITSTRFLDILILIQRSYTALRQVSRLVRQAEVSVKEEISDQQDLETRQLHLKQRFKLLLEAQVKFAKLRNTLWYNQIPRRELDTYLMLTARKEMGVQGLYDDLVDEVQLCREIYDLAYHEIKTELSQQAQLDQENIVEQQRKLSNRQQDIFLILTIISAIAIPTSLLNDGLDVTHKILGGNEYKIVDFILLFCLLGFFIFLGIRVYRRFRSADVNSPEKTDGNSGAGE